MSMTVPAFVIRAAATAGQVIFLAAVLLGVFIIGGIPWLLVVGGGLGLVACVAAEAATTTRTSSPDDRKAA